MKWIPLLANLDLAKNSKSIILSCPDNQDVLYFETHCKRRPRQVFEMHEFTRVRREIKIFKQKAKGTLWVQKE